VVAVDGACRVHCHSDMRQLGMPKVVRPVHEPANMSYHVGIPTAKHDTRGVAPFLLAAVEWKARNKIESWFRSSSQLSCHQVNTFSQRTFGADDHGLLLSPFATVTLPHKHDSKRAR
jgi:hypothetical protein